MASISDNFESDEDFVRRIRKEYELQLLAKDLRRDSSYAEFYRLRRRLEHEIWIKQTDFKDRWVCLLSEAAIFDLSRLPANLQERFESGKNHQREFKRRYRRLDKMKRYLEFEAGERTAIPKSLEGQEKELKNLQKERESLLSSVEELLADIGTFIRGRGDR